MTAVAMVGLSYVGLPLAVEFGRRYETIGYDHSEQEVSAYRAYLDSTGELSEAEVRAATRRRATADASEVATADFGVVAVPAPVDGARTSLNELLEIIRDDLLQRVQSVSRIRPTYRDFRPGDVGHSQVDISKTRRFLDYIPLLDVEAGRRAGMAWYLDIMTYLDTLALGDSACRILLVGPSRL